MLIESDYCTTKSLKDVGVEALRNRQTYLHAQIKKLLMEVDLLQNELRRREE